MNYQFVNIHSDAKIAQNVIIEPFTSIGKNVIIGEGTKIGPNVTILEGSRIGKNCNIFPGAVIGAIPQDLKFIGEETTAEIGDNTTIREYVTVNRGTKVTGKTVIGNNCLLMAYVHIAHDCVLGNNVILSNCVQVAGEVIIDDWAIIGGLAGVHQFVRIGEHVMIRGGALVAKDVPPFAKAVRDPIYYAGVNSVGLRRRNFSNEQIYAIQDCYRILYQSNLNVTNALQKIEADIPPSKERDDIINFIRNSKRGIIKGHNAQTENGDE